MTPKVIEGHIRSLLYFIFLPIMQKVAKTSLYFRFPPPLFLVYSATSGADNFSPHENFSAPSLNIYKNIICPWWKNTDNTPANTFVSSLFWRLFLISLTFVLLTVLGGFRLILGDVPNIVQRGSHYFDNLWGKSEIYYVNPLRVFKETIQLTLDKTISKHIKVRNFHYFLYSLKRAPYKTRLTKGRVGDIGLFNQ